MYTFDLRNPSDATHFTLFGTEYEMRVTDDAEVVEVWTVEYDEDGKCGGLGEFVTSWRI